MIRRRHLRRQEESSERVTFEWNLQRTVLILIFRKRKTFSSQLSVGRYDGKMICHVFSPGFTFALARSLTSENENISGIERKRTFETNFCLFQCTFNGRCVILVVSERCFLFHNAFVARTTGEEKLSVWRRWPPARIALGCFSGFFKRRAKYV